MRRLEQLRLDAGLSREQLALKADVSYRTILRAEGDKGARVDTLVKLAEALNARPSELLLPAPPLAPEPPGGTRLAGAQTTGSDGEQEAA